MNAEAPSERGAATRFDPEPWRGELLTFMRRLGAGSEAEDCVQEAFARACAEPPRTHPRAWLYRTAVNVFHDFRRRADAGRRALRGVGRTAPEAAPAGERPDRAAESRELADAAWAAVRLLPEKQRLALWLRLQRQMDFDEIATALDCGVATARQHLYLGLKAVRARLGDLV
jgi:RNA polymerase sigma-70 factor (ECF subfamily)